MFDGQSVALIAIAGARRALCVLGLAALLGCQSTEPTPGASFHAPVSGTPPFDAATVARADAGAVVDARSIADVGVISNAGADSRSRARSPGYPGRTRRTPPQPRARACLAGLSTYVRRSPVCSLASAACLVPQTPPGVRSARERRSWARNGPHTKSDGFDRDAERVRERHDVRVARVLALGHCPINHLVHRRAESGDQCEGGGCVSLMTF